eukprot:360484-Chlamydomonas_euryale.AAC.6
MCTCHRRRVSSAPRCPSRRGSCGRPRRSPSLGSWLWWQSLRTARIGGGGIGRGGACRWRVGAARCRAGGALADAVACVMLGRRPCRDQFAGAAATRAPVRAPAALAASAASSAARCSSLRKLPIDPAVFAALMACAGLLLFLLRTLPNRPEGAGQGPFEQRGGGGELPDASAADRSRSWADAAPPRRSSLRHKRTRCSATLSNSGRARRRAVRACGRSGRCRDAEGGEVLPAGCGRQADIGVAPRHALGGVGFSPDCVPPRHVRWAGAGAHRSERLQR